MKRFLIISLVLLFAGGGRLSVQVLTRQLKTANQELGQKTAMLETLKAECDELSQDVKAYYTLQGDYKTLKRNYTIMKDNQGAIVKQRKQLLQLKEKNVLLKQKMGKVDSLEVVAQNYKQQLKCTKIAPFNTSAGRAVRIADDDVQWFSRAELKAVKKRFGEWSAQLLQAPKFIPLNAEMYLQAGQETQALQSINYEVSDGVCELTIPDVEYYRQRSRLI